MPKTKLQKQQIVTDLTDKVSRSNSMVFADYKGMTMSQLSDVRNQLAENSAEFTVTKNNLLKIALKENKTEIDEKLLEGPVATLFTCGYLICFWR
jgi:large subunit ribosomal protein L10